MEAPANFHARFSAAQRTYHYYIYQHSVPSALKAGQLLWEPRPLSVDAMHNAAQMLLGEHDFSAFRSQKCQAHSPIKNVHRCEVRQLSDGVIVMRITANSFLYNMVRNIMGVLLAIGHGKQPPEAMRAILASKTRRHAGVKVAPHGLYFMHVAYPDWPEANQYIEKYLF
jgi:tRNA pseudouridine38-40 synthase